MYNLLSNYDVLSWSYPVEFDLLVSSRIFMYMFMKDWSTFFFSFFFATQAFL